MRIILQPLARDACELRRSRRQCCLDHRVYWLPETLILEPHAQRQLAEELHIRLALARRVNRLLRNLKVVVPVGLDQVLVLEESCRGKNQVRKVSCVGEELFMHDREQVVAL